MKKRVCRHLSLFLAALMLFALVSCGGGGGEETGTGDTRTEDTGTDTRPAETETDKNMETTTETDIGTASDTDAQTTAETTSVPVSDGEALALTPSDGKKLRIACIGDSITFGYGASDPNAYSWPALLQKKIGTDRAEVGNFGKSSSYATEADDPFNVRDKALSYRATEEYKKSLTFGADVVIIMLGINDGSNFSSLEACEHFKSALVSLAKEYAALQTVQRVYIATSIRVLITARAEQISDGYLQQIQKDAAAEAGVSLMDIHALTRNYYDFMIHYTKDRLHPNDDTYGAIAEAAYSVLSGVPYEEPTIPTAKNGVVYLSAGGSFKNDGATPSTPVSSFGIAAGLLRDTGGTIVLCGNYTVVSETHLPETHKPITVTSVYDGKTYPTTLYMKNPLYLGGDYTLENLHIECSAESTMVVCEYHNTHFASGITCTLADGIKQPPVIVAGYNVALGGITPDEVSLHENCGITVDSGTWYYLRSGNRRANAAFPFGTVDAGATLDVTINGGTFTSTSGTYMVTATGMNAVEGKCVLTINGGEFAGGVFGVSRAGGAPGGSSAPEVSGTVEVHINGGTIKGKIKGVTDATATLTGKCVLYLGKNALSYEKQASGFTSVEK